MLLLHVWAFAAVRAVFAALAFAAAVGAVLAAVFAAAGIAVFAAGGVVGDGRVLAGDAGGDETCGKDQTAE